MRLFISAPPQDFFAPAVVGCGWLRQRTSAFDGSLVRVFLGLMQNSARSCRFRFTGCALE